jgi:hypothetical protein
VRSCLLCVCVPRQKVRQPNGSRAFSLQCADLLMSRSARVRAFIVSHHAPQIKKSRGARQGAESEDIHPAPNCRLGAVEFMGDPADRHPLSNRLSKNMVVIVRPRTRKESAHGSSPRTLRETQFQ